MIFIRWPNCFLSFEKFSFPCVSPGLQWPSQPELCDEIRPTVCGAVPASGDVTHGCLVQAQAHAGERTCSHTLDCPHTLIKALASERHTELPNLTNFS